jgi:beta-phosphoglucomutase-like phosphatase (HAD superfamily)
MAAKRAGMQCVAIPNSITEGLDLSHADIVLDSLAHITLADLFGRLARPDRRP